MLRVKPKGLSLGDTIGIIAPASPASKEKAEMAIAHFRNYGYKVKLGESVDSQYGYLSGRDGLRAKDVNQMFSDHEVKGIICLRGGYGTPRILGRIDYEVIQSHPKIFVGYSDITALHLAIQNQTGLVTFHGPMITELADNPDPLTWPTLFRHLTDPTPIGRYGEPKGMFQCTVFPGVAQGPLVGGNLSLITATLGTPYEIETEGRILFLEDVGEKPYCIDRMLTQLKLAGKLQRAKGIVLTDFSDSDPVPGRDSLRLEEVFHDILKPLGIPCYYGLKVGHCEPNLTMPLGIMTRLNATEGWIQFLEGGVR